MTSPLPRLAYALSSDAVLLGLLPSDDQGAFAEIYERYWYRVFALAYRKLKSREVAEELVQDLFETLWAKRTQQAIEQLEQYLFSAINYRIVSYVRSRKIREGYAEYCLMHQEEATQETEEVLAEADLSITLLKGLSQLPEKSREVFRLSRFEHYSVQEISLRLNVTPKAVEYHLTKSIKLLRGYLRDFLVVALPLWLLFR